MMARHATALLAYLVLAATPLLAQRTHVRLSPGVRVRVDTPARPGWVVGTVAAADPERIVLRSAPPVALDTVPIAGVQAVEVSDGRNRVGRAIAGIIIGGVGGAAIGALIGQRASPLDEALGVYYGALFGTAVGAVAGGTVGAITAPERWRPAPAR